MRKHTLSANQQKAAVMFEGKGFAVFHLHSKWVLIIISFHKPKVGHFISFKGNCLKKKTPECLYV